MRPEPTATSPDETRIAKFQAERREAWMARLGPRVVWVQGFNDWFFRHYVVGMLVGVPLAFVTVVAFMFFCSSLLQALPIDPSMKGDGATFGLMEMVIVIGGIAVNIEVRRRLASGIRKRTGVAVAWWRIPLVGIVVWYTDLFVFDAWLAQQRNHPATDGDRRLAWLLAACVLALGAASVPVIVAHPQLGAILGALGLWGVAYSRP
jgi:hypothetical protein